jgi:DNA-binding SARP family transcriptional activator
LTRRRLLDELDRLRTTRLALVIAPAGAGKTTLLAQYASRWDGPVGWWQVEPGCRVTGVVRGLAAAVPGLSDVLDPAAADLDALVAGLDRASPGQVLLVVDDTHRLTDPAATAALETVINGAPQRLHTLVGGRRMPDLNVSRHELANVYIVDGELLRFRTWEVEHLLRDVYREPLPPDDAAALSRRVGGLAAGLHMFHLSTRGQPLPQRRRAVAALDGRSALTRAYLTRTVLAELPEELRVFLIRTCVFDVLTESRCERLLDRPGTSKRHLAELERRQAFTVTHDGGRTYRYHEVLRAHLAVMLAEEVGDARARQWHARAGALLAADGANIAAARAYARAEDWTAVSWLLNLIGADDDVEPWHDVVPAWLIAEDPWLMLAEGRRLLGRGKLTAGVDLLRAAEEHFDEDRGRARCRTVRRLAQAWLPGTPLPGPMHYSVLLRDATRRHPALVAATGQPVVQAVAFLLGGNITEVRRLVPNEPPDSPDPQALILRLVNACLALAGGDDTARQVLAGVVVDIERIGLHWLTRLARAAAVLDGSKDGIEAAREVLEESDNDGDLWGGALALTGLCLMRSVDHSSDPADVEDAHDLVRRCRLLDAGVLDAWAHALLALAAVAAGLPDAAVEAQRAEGLARSAGVPGAYAAAQVAAARCTGARIDPGGLAAESGLPVRVITRWLGTEAARSLEAPPVEVCCFDGFRMRLHGQPVYLTALKPRTRTALRLLAVHAGRAVHRETMIEALWPDLSPTAATRNLHVTLSSLRTFLEPGAPRGHSALLTRDGDAYQLTLPDDSYSDIVAFTAAVDTARRAQLAGEPAATADALRAALLAYTGELLPEEGPAEWVVRERERLRQTAVEAALDLARTLLKLGDAVGAVAAAERCVQIDQYCDRGWQLLTDAYDQLDNRAAAARARQRYATVLASLEAPDRAVTPAQRSPARPGRTPSPPPSRKPT